VYISGLWASMMSNQLNSNQILHKGKPHKIKRIWRPHAKQLNAHLLCSFFSPCFSPRSRVCIFELDPHPLQHGSASDSNGMFNSQLLPSLSKVTTTSPISCEELASTIFSTGGIAEAHERPKSTSSSTTGMIMDPITARAPSRYTMAGASAES
jgi:hypothetical protein